MTVSTVSLRRRGLMLDNIVVGWMNISILSVGPFSLAFSNIGDDGAASSVAAVAHRSALTV